MWLTLQKQYLLSALQTLFPQFLYCICLSFTRQLPYLQFFMSDLLGQMFFMKIFSPSESIHGRYASWVSFLSAPDASHRAGILRLYFFIEVKVTYSKLLSVQFGKVDIFYPCESITTITIINTCIDGPQSLLVTIGNLFSLTLHL